MLRLRLPGFILSKPPRKPQIAPPRDGPLGRTNSATGTALIFRVASLEEETRFFVAFFMEVVKEVRVRTARQLASQAINVLRQGFQIRFRIGRAQIEHSSLQLQKGVQYFFLEHGHREARIESTFPFAKDRTGVEKTASCKIIGGWQEDRKHQS